MRQIGAQATTRPDESRLCRRQVRNKRQLDVFLSILSAAVPMRFCHSANGLVEACIFEVRWLGLNFE
jgi:hypothetical protein